MNRRAVGWDASSDHVTVAGVTVRCPLTLSIECMQKGESNALCVRVRGTVRTA